jgi:hypothetical protein
LKTLSGTSPSIYPVRQETGNRKQETGNRKQETGNREERSGVRGEPR